MVYLEVGGSMVDLETDAAKELYEELWRVAADQRGAVTAAARLRHAIAYARTSRVIFEGDEASVVRAALDRISA